MRLDSRWAFGFASALALSGRPVAFAETVEPSNQVDRVIVTGVADRQLLDAATPTGSRLSRSLRETPAIVDILSQALMQERGLPAPLPSFRMREASVAERIGAVTPLAARLAVLGMALAVVGLRAAGSWPRDL